MGGSGDVGAFRRDLVAPTVRLIEFLRRLASTRYTPVRDVRDHLSVSWLGDLPTTIDLNPLAGPGEVLCTIDPISAEPYPQLPVSLSGWVDPVEAAKSDLDAPSLRDQHPSGSGGDLPQAPPAEVKQAFDAWLRQWQIWAEADRRTASHRSWYGTLADAYQQLDQHSDEVELVIAAGMIGWRTPAGAAVRTHLLTTRAKITVDVETGRLELLMDPEAITRIADRELLSGEAGFDSTRAEPIRQRLREGTPLPLDDEMKDILERWRNLALERSRPYDHDGWNPVDEIDETAQLRLAPAVVLRKRDTATLLGYYDRMLETLSGPDAEAPLGLAQLLVALEPEDRIEWLDAEGTGGTGIDENPLFPLPSNDEQRQVIDRLRHDNGVVVQGPPGTGKSHSIANLIAALLAQGHRVLVTSQKAQALRVLADKLPPDIAELCVSMTDLARGGSAELNRSVNALSERYGNHDPMAHATAVAELVTRRGREQSRVATVRERIRSLREAETYQHPEIAPGYAGTLGAISAALRSNDSICSWVPTPLPSAAPPVGPLSVEELGQLRRLLSAITPARRARANQQLPDLESLPSGPTVRSWFAAEAAATDAAGAVATDMSRRLARCEPQVVDVIADTIRATRSELTSLGIPNVTGSSDKSDWRVQALSDGFARREVTVWEQLLAVSKEATSARDNLEALGLHLVTLPEFDANGPTSLGAQIRAGRALRDYLAGGGKLRRFKPKPVQRAAERLLTEASVDGIRPTTLELLDLALAYADAQVTATALAEQWSIVRLDVDRELPLLRRVGLFVEAAEQLSSIRRIVEARDRAVAQLTEAGVSMALADLDHWLDLETALAAVLVQREADEATADVAEHTAALDLRARATTAPPELSIATRALSSRDVVRYEAALNALADAHVEQRDQRQCDALLARLHGAHPGLAQLLERTATDDVWDERIATFPRAWAWAKAKTFFDSQRQPGLDTALDTEFEDAVARLESATVRLAAAEAWGHTLQRMNASQAQALQVYRQAMSDRGAGKGRYAHKFEKAARQAMVAARGAVPAWIMPLAEVLETVPPDRNSFDVVIVDEASQASIEALFLLWLAPRVIVVGDDRQCTPSQVSHGELQPIFDALDEYLPDIPEYLRVAFTPRSSLFSLLATRFGSVIRLREHFRCMPEIIGWSSRQFYSDAPLIPLRQYGADRLQPLRCTHVPGAYAEGTSTRLRNPMEAEAIADAVAACMDDPAYDHKTFGVIALQGAGQIALIQDLLHARLPTSAWEQRRLRVGTPPDFQGDERHVMFLSMVVAETPRAVTMLEWQRRFNVAASRAQDQMWLFHSVTLDALSPVDLRRSLLSYSMNPPAPDTTRRLDDVTDDAPHPAFDSLFEQRVFNRIRGRGYHVTPQLEVNARRIDLVVTGARGRLAVECDGDAWHTSAEQREADLHRELDLKRAGWKFWRIRESEFYFDPDSAMSTLWSTLDARGIRPHDLVSVTAGTDDSGGLDWLPLAAVSVEGVDGIDDDPLGAAGLDLVEPGRTRPRVARATAHRGWPMRGSRSTVIARAGDSGRAGEYRSATGDTGAEAQPVYHEPSADARAPASSVVDTPPFTADTEPRGEETAYAAWQMNPLPPLFPTDRETIARGLVQIATVEGPVVCERLFQLYVKSSGGQRVRSLVRERLFESLNIAVKRGWLTVRDELLTPDDRMAHVVRTSGSPPVVLRPRGDRSIHEIPPSELAMRLAQIRTRQPGLVPDQVRRELLGELGLTRLTESTLARLDLIDRTIRLP